MISGAGAVVVRCILAVASLVIVAVWTDSLLRVTERTAEVVLNVSELEEFSEPELEEVAEEAPPNESDEQVVARPETLANAELVPGESPKDAIVPHDVVQSDDVPEIAELPPVAEPSSATQFTTGAEGSLTSFAGAGASNTSDADESGSGEGATWNIDVHGASSLRDLTNVPATQLVAVRQVRGYWEVVLVSDRSVSSPISVDRFRDQRAAFSAGQGVVLDRKLMSGIKERLVTYGSGWQLWLLIEDHVFNRWVVQLREHLSQRKKNWSDVETVEARLAVTARRSVKFQVLGVTWKPVAVEESEEASGTSAEASTGDAQQPEVVSPSEATLSSGRDEVDVRNDDRGAP